MVMYYIPGWEDAGHSLFSQSSETRDLPPAPITEQIAIDLAQSESSYILTLTVAIELKSYPV